MISHSRDFAVMVKKRRKGKEERSSTTKNLSDYAIKIARRSIGEKNACLLKALCYLKKNQRVTFLRGADNNFVKCIQECAFNTLEGNVPLACNEKKHLAKHKSILRRVAAKRGSWKTKRKLLVQRGGFLPYLIGPILGAVLSQIIG